MPKPFISKVAIILAVFAAVAVVPAAYAGGRAGLEGVAHARVCVPTPGYYEAQFARAYAPESQLGRGDGGAVNASHSRLIADDELALPGAAFSQQQLEGYSLNLAGDTALKPRSLTVLAGVLPDTTESQARENGYTTGLAWQSQGEAGNRLGLDTFYSKGAGFGGDSQWLTSLSSQFTPLPGLTGITVKTEVAALQRWNTPGRGGSTAARVSLAGPAGMPFQYDVTLARYGAGFQPLGSLVTANWEGVIANASYHFTSGMQLDTSFDYGRMVLASVEPQDTRRAQVALSGHLLRYLVPSLKDILGDPLEEAPADAGLLRNTWHYIMKVLAQPFSGACNYRMGFILQKRADGLGGRGAVSRGFRVAGNHPLDLGWVKGSIGPGFAWRDYVHSPLRDSFETGVALDLHHSAHHLAFDVGYLAREGVGARANQDAMKFSIHYSLTFDGPNSPVASLSTAWYMPDSTGFF